MQVLFKQPDYKKILNNNEISSDINKKIKTFIQKYDNDGVLEVPKYLDKGDSSNKNDSKTSLNKSRKPT